MIDDTMSRVLGILESKGVVVIVDGSQVILDCRGSELNEDDFKSLGEIDTLVWLSCDDLEIDSGLTSAVSQLKSLEYLSLCDCNIHSEMLTDLGQLASLKILRLQGLRGARFLPEQIRLLSSLESLDISRSDAGSAVLSELLGMEALTDIKLEGTGISRDEVEALNRESPNANRFISIQLGDGSHATITRP